MSLKLDSSRPKDIGDVGEMIKINNLPRNYAVNAAVSKSYTKMWDAIHDKAEMLEAFCEILGSKL